MTIEVIGSGALGMLFGARLASSGSTVQMWTRTPEQAELINNEGIHYTDLLGRTEVVRVTCTLGSASPSNDTEWILLAVKQTAIDECISVLANIATPHTPVLCLQNGIGHMEKLRSRLPDIPFFAAVSTEGALRTGQNSVMYTGEGDLWIEDWPDMGERSSRLLLARTEMISDLRMANVNAQLSANMDAMILRKLLVNSVINPLSAIYGVSNGQLPADPLRLKLMKALFEETRGVLEAAQDKSLGDQLWEYILKVCNDTASNESSMLSDVRAQRQTEVKWINGGVVEQANHMNAQAPLNKAMVVLVESLVGCPALE